MKSNELCQMTFVMHGVGLVGIWMGKLPAGIPSNISSRHRSFLLLVCFLGSVGMKFLTMKAKGVCQMLAVRVVDQTVPTVLGRISNRMNKSRFLMEFAFNLRSHGAKYGFSARITSMFVCKRVACSCMGSWQRRTWKIDVNKPGTNC